jgi:hypothetical protein
VHLVTGFGGILPDKRDTSDPKPSRLLKPAGILFYLGGCFACLFVNVLPVTVTGLVF